jgi:hypothetical protein
MNEDIQQPTLDELKWGDAERGASLSAVYRHAVDYARESESWYAKERVPKRYWGQGLRAAAIVLGAIAAVLPVLSELSTSEGVPNIPPAWSTVALAAAAALVGLDRYFGFSSAWMRFMVTGQRIASLRHRFEFHWQEARSSSGEPPSGDELAVLLGLAQGLEAEVDDAIEKETGAWVAEFNSALEQIDRETQLKKSSQRQSRHGTA